MCVCVCRYIYTCSVSPISHKKLPFAKKKSSTMHNICSDESARPRCVRFDMCGRRMLLRSMTDSNEKR